MRRAWLEQAPLLTLVAVYVAGVYAAERAVGLREPLRNVGFGNFYFIFAVAALCYAAGALLWARTRVRDAHGRWIASWDGWRLAWEECRRSCFGRYRAGTAVVACIAVLMLLRTYASWKPLIPDVRAYGLDPALMRLDRALHFGRDPWHVLHPILGYAPVTLAVDLLYALWLPLNFIVLLWQIASARAVERVRFLVSYALIWIVLGTVLATWLASAGPCYYDRLVEGPNPFAPLMHYLGDLHTGYGLIALQIQENLWTYYSGREVLPLNGISAMPSIHVAVAVLFALAGWRAGRWTGWLLTAYAGLVLVGSVHLGWHYAVDGYLSALGTGVIWVGSGALTGRYFKAMGLGVG